MSSKWPEAVLAGAPAAALPISEIAAVREAPGSTATSHPVVVGAGE